MTRNTRVLVVDDEVSLAEVLSDIFQSEGYECVAVNSGKEAIGKVKEMSFDVILMDIKMPIMNGVEAFKIIKKICPDTIVIMMTAFSVEDLINDALQEGAYGVLHKPFDIDMVISRIETAKEGGGLIMITDDNSSTREILKDILEQKGYVVNTAADGPSAIDLEREKPHNIVFIDMKMPVLNGLETYLALKKINPAIVAIMVTAYRQEMADIADQALQKGAYCCIEKPFEPQEIVKVVQDIIKKQKS